MRLYRIEIRVGLSSIKLFVCPHYRYQVFGLGEVDDVMCVAGEHVYGFYLVATYFELYHLVGAYLAFLYKSVTTHHYKELPFAVVPMLSFGDAGFRDVYAHLSNVFRLQ